MKRIKVVYVTPGAIVRVMGVTARIDFSEPWDDNNWHLEMTAILWGTKIAFNLPNETMVSVGR